MTTATSRAAWRTGSPWSAQAAMMIGFFMIMVDSTIVAIANPTIMADLHTGYASVVWVTSAYLLGYAVVMLVAGRLGDQFGSKNLYLIGLVVFTLASLWCGLSDSVAMLIAARLVQGVGAGVLTPQTLSVTTQIFPPQQRGAAVSVWGATAGIASLVGPLAGGALVDGLGWDWIFYVNIPIGIIGLALAVWLVPELPTHRHKFDLVGVALSGAGMFLIVFGLQQGQAARWEPWIWAMIVAGIGFMSAFVYWQAVNPREPLIPLDIFGDRDFSLSNVGVAIISLATTAMILPLTFYTQTVCGLTPLRSALVIAPMAILNGVLAPFVGRLVDKYHPRPVIGFGFSMLAIGLTWLAFEMAPDTPIWRLLLPFGVIGIASAFVWSPLTATATRNLPPRLAGTGSAVFNTIRQLGAVLGSAAMAAFMAARIGAEMPPDVPSVADTTGLELPEFLHQPFSVAMSQSVLLPAFIVLFGIVAALFFVGGTPSAPRNRGDAVYDEMVDDDDDYVELILRRESDLAPRLGARREPRYREADTEPLGRPVPHPRPAPGHRWHSEPVDSWHRLLADPVSRAEPIGLAHNGSHADSERRLRPIAEFSPRARPPRGPARPRMTDGEAPRSRHYRPDPDDSASGRHSSAN